MILGIKVRPDKYTKWIAEKLEKLPDELRKSEYDIITVIGDDTQSIYIKKPCDISIDEVLEYVNVYRSFLL